MFARTLQRQGFWKARTGEDTNGKRIFLRHDLYLGGIYVEIEKRLAIVRINELGIIRVFKSIKALKEFLLELESVKSRIAFGSPSLQSIVSLSSE